MIFRPPQSLFRVCVLDGLRDEIAYNLIGQSRYAWEVERCLKGSKAALH